MLGRQEVRDPLGVCGAISVRSLNELMSVNEPSQLEENVDICFYATSVLDEAFVTKLQSYKFNIIYIGPYLLLVLVNIGKYELEFWYVSIWYLL